MRICAPQAQALNMQVCRYYLWQPYTCSFYYRTIFITIFQNFLVYYSLLNYALSSSSSSSSLLSSHSFAGNRPRTHSLPVAVQAIESIKFILHLHAIIDPKIALCYIYRFGGIYSNQMPSINAKQFLVKSSNCDSYITIRRHDNLCFSIKILRKHLDYEIISHFCRRRLVVFVVFIIVAVVSRR